MVNATECENLIRNLLTIPCNQERLNTELFAFSVC